jgi:alkyl hydroperoxide reductase subunit AhpC
MTLRLGDTAPDFRAETTRGRIDFHAWLGDSWGLLFSHPRDFTPVCTTELGRLALLERDFERRDVKLLGLSVDTVFSHEEWLLDIRETQGATVHFPIVGDLDRSVALSYGMLPADVRPQLRRNPARDRFAAAHGFMRRGDARELACWR